MNLNPKSSRWRCGITLGALTVLILISVNARLDAHEGATGIVKERQQGMVAFKNAMKTWKLVLQGQKAAGPEVIGEISRKLSSHAGARLTELYPKDGPTRHTDASPAIWTEWDKFSELAEALKTRALALPALVAAAEKDQSVLHSEFKAIGKICKACHESFRER